MSVTSKLSPRPVRRRTQPRGLILRELRSEYGPDLSRVVPGVDGLVVVYDATDEGGRVDAMEMCAILAALGCRFVVETLPVERQGQRELTSLAFNAAQTFTKQQLLAHCERHLRAVRAHQRLRDPKTQRFVSRDRYLALIGQQPQLFDQDEETF